MPDERRLERISELLKRSLSEILVREFGGMPDMGIVTVHEVEVSKDLSYATAYVGIVGSPEIQQRTYAVLQKYRSLIQDQLVHSVVLRRAPKLRFVLDKSVERGTRTLQILDELSQADGGSAGMEAGHAQSDKTPPAQSQ